MWPTTLALVLSAVVPVFLVSATAIGGSHAALTERARTDITVLADAQAARVDLIASAGETNARLIASRTQLRRDLAALIDGDTDRQERVEDIVDDAVRSTPQVLGVALLDTTGAVRGGSTQLGAAALPEVRAAALADPIAVRSTILADEAGDRWLVLAPLLLDGRVLGTAVVELDLTGVGEVITPVDGTRIRTCLSRADGDGGTVALRAATPGVIDECEVAARAGQAPAALLATLLEDPTTVAEGVDAAGTPVLAAGREITGPGWAVVVSVPRAVLLEPLRASAVNLAIAATVIALLAAAVAVVLARRITRPVVELSDTVRDLGEGELAARADTDAPGELGELAEGVNTMAAGIEEEAEEREQRYRDLEVLTHAMAHDLKSPLTAVHGMLELTVNGRVTDPDQQAQLLERAHGAARRMQRIIDDLLTLVRAHGGPLEPRAVDLDAVVEQVVTDLDAAAWVACEPLPTVPGDPVLLGHVVQNLVSNALSYHAPGEEPRVRISAQDVDRGVELWVEDAGVGIPEDEREEALALFFRGERTKRTKGTGLGLPIAVRAVERHGGHLRIEDATLGGARMVVWLPVPAAPAPATA